MPASQTLDTEIGTAVSIRIRRYINKHWDGNLTVAAKALGCKYKSLRSGALGHSWPNLDLLRALAKHSGDTMDWWLR